MRSTVESVRKILKELGAIQYVNNIVSYNINNNHKYRLHIVEGEEEWDNVIDDIIDSGRIDILTSDEEERIIFIQLKG